jgi:hypothetical protein
VAETSPGNEVNDRTILITVIGRGHSGTRAISHTLSASGVHMGAKLNKSGDLIPGHDLYKASRIMARHVKHLGGPKWDFSELHTMAIDPAFKRLVMTYLASVLSSNAEHRGWKLPETTLVYPWIARMFPNARYIYWIRDPRDSIIGRHMTDDLANFGVPYDRVDDLRERRAISWKYQSDIFHSTPRPKHLLKLRFEDFVLRQAETLAKLENYLGFPMATIETRPESVGRWKTDDGVHDFPFFQDELRAYGYI